MKRMLAILAVLGLGGVVMALNIPTPGGGQPNAPAKLVVHEWGTFTGFAGSDGVHLPIGITVGNDLPAFVFTRREQAQRQGVRLNEFVFDGGKGGGTFALQRMETPVVYFYTPQPRDVSVAVDFPQGQLSEFYPPVRAMTPAFGEGPGEYSWVQREPTTQPAAALKAPLAPPRPAKFERGSLDWGVVRIVPQRAGERPAYMPDVPATPEAAAHYRYARETDAATVQFSDRPGERHDERFLFYRGLGDFTLPVTLTAQDDDHYELSNTSGQPIGAALLLRVADGRARFAVYRDIGARQSMTLPAKTVALVEVGDAIVHALIAEGLYEKEARAMVKTWRSQWLGDAGTRVLYTVPRATTDQLLPLRVAPTPDQTVRVLVGRIDVITPPQEARIGSLLASSLTAKRMSADDAAFLRGFGRFVEPAIERAAALRGGRGGDEGAQTARHEMNRLRSLYYNAPKPAAAPAQAAPAP